MIHDDDILMVGQFRWCAISSRNASRSGQLPKSGGRSSHSLAVLGKKENLWALISSIQYLFVNVWFDLQPLVSYMP